MSSVAVIDTNVPVVANGKTPQASQDCVMTCIDALLTIREKGQILLDESGFILQEYRRYLSPAGQPGAGDEFFKWLWDNQGNVRYCRRVAVTVLDEEGCDFAEFPKDPELKAFDRGDKKFVAVALASGRVAQILNASDTDWWHFREVLEKQGMKIRFLCPELMTEKRYC